MNNKKVPTQRSTQEIIDIAEIKDDVVVLKDGTMRAVLMVSSINFALKNRDEQESIISGYYAFLNSILYPLQIVIQSRPIDIESYLEKLDALAKQQINELLRIQTLDYLQFIKELLELQAIMTKKFYVVIPYSSLEKTKKSFLTKFYDALSPSRMIAVKQKQFIQYKEQLFRRASSVQEGLASMGIQAVPLDTASLIELYYNCYNPEIAKNQKLNNIEKIQVDV